MLYIYTYSATKKFILVNSFVENPALLKYANTIASKYCNIKQVMHFIAVQITSSTSHFPLVS